MDTTWTERGANPSPASAQSRRTLLGKLVKGDDQSKSPVANAAVVLDESGSHDTSNRDGLFSLFLPIQRWPVKILTDKDRAMVDFKPADTTVTALNNFKRNTVAQYDRRVKDEELRVYRVRARLVAIHDETDSDLHLVIAEPDRPEVTMIAEIPAPLCAIGSGHEGDYETARAAPVKR